MSTPKNVLEHKYQTVIAEIHLRIWFAEKWKD